MRHLSMGAMLSEMLTPKDGHRDELSEALLIMPRYEATLSGVLPNRKTRAGGPPCIHHFTIRPRSGSDPFEQIEYQGFYRIRQRGLSSSDLSAQVLARWYGGSFWFGRGLGTGKSTDELARGEQENKNAEAHAGQHRLGVADGVVGVLRKAQRAESEGEAQKT